MFSLFEGKRFDLGLYEAGGTRSVHFERSGISPRGKVVGKFRGMGNQPRVLERLKGYGIHLSRSIFDEVVEVHDK